MFFSWFSDFSPTKSGVDIDTNDKNRYIFLDYFGEVRQSTRFIALLAGLEECRTDFLVCLV
jgi:hypothetical protein